MAVVSHLLWSLHRSQCTRCANALETTMDSRACLLMVVVHEIVMASRATARRMALTSSLWITRHALIKELSYGNLPELAPVVPVRGKDDDPLAVCELANGGAHRPQRERHFVRIHHLACASGDVDTTTVGCLPIPSSMTVLWRHATRGHASISEAVTLKQPPQKIIYFRRWTAYEARFRKYRPKPSSKGPFQYFKLAPEF